MDMEGLERLLEDNFTNVRSDIQELKGTIDSNSMNGCAYGRVTRSSGRMIIAVILSLSAIAGAIKVIAEVL